VAGDVREFIQTNYWNMLVKSVWMTPTVQLAPCGSYRWEHALPEFIDDRRRLRTGLGNSIAFPILSAEVQPGCEIWCALDVRQEKEAPPSTAGLTRRPPKLYQPSSISKMTPPNNTQQ